MTEPNTPHRRGFLASLRASFLTGLVVVLPIGLTIYFVWAFIGWLDGWILPLIPAYWQPNAVILRWFGPEYEFPVRGVGVLVFLVVTIIIGWLAKGLIGRSIIRSGEDLVDRMPVVRSVYGAIKQVAETFFNKKEKSFDKVVLVEFPRPGSWALGFLSTRPDRDGHGRGRRGQADRLGRAGLSLAQGPPALSQHRGKVHSRLAADPGAPIDQELLRRRPPRRLEPAQKQRRG